MVDAAATMALETLRDLLIEEVRFLSSVGGQVEDVRRGLQRMRDFLKDADKFPDIYDSAIVRGRVSELIDLATSAEDVLERHAVEVVSKRGAKNLKKRLKRFTCILSECLALHKIGKETEGIKSRMTELTKQLESISHGDGRSSFGCNDDQQSQRQTYGHEIEESFVGMENDIECLVSLLMQNDDRSYRVISICGMGGLGKTTLARKIYQHKDIPICFEASAWVCITQKLQTKAIFQEILRQLLLPKEIKEQMKEAELVSKLYGILKEKKCLVVVDDIWEVDHWDKLQQAFPLAGSNSKILLTTRDETVACTAGFVHKLGFLTEDESWNLLQKIALPINESEDTGRQLVRRCGCLPLAVSVIGGILRRQQNLDWKIVLNNMDSYLMHGIGVDANDDQRVKHVLKLSYNVLPYHLKLCFLYLGCFPKDMDIDVEDVYLIWMAEGLISSDDKGLNETLRDVAERYLNELASKCMVQVKIMTDENTLKSLKSYRLHDFLRDLCLSKGKEVKFLENSQGKNRRLAINLGDDHERIVAKFKNANLRSLLLCGKIGFSDITNIWKDLLVHALLKSLKVLVLENCKFEDKKLPVAVRKLVMLKHLSIKHSLVLEVPEFVCKLPCLQSLDLRAEEYITLSYSINKMGRLRHLFLYPCRVKVIDGGTLKLEDGGVLRFEGGRLISLDGLTELETLIGFNSEIFYTKHLLKLINLRRFGGYVHDIESLSVVVEHMIKLKAQLREARLEIHVEDLNSEQGAILIDSLMHCPLNNLSIYGRLGRLPNWKPPQLLENLVSLILDGSEFREDPMEILQHLPKLRSLWLGNGAFVGTVMVCGSKGFPQLKSLTLRGLRNLVRWRVEKGAMSNLSDLLISFCPKLEMIPEGIIFMESIKKLDVGGMPSNFKERLRRGGEDYHKIRHIPFLDLY